MNRIASLAHEKTHAVLLHGFRGFVLFYAWRVVYACEDGLPGSEVEVEVEVVSRGVSAGGESVCE